MPGAEGVTFASGSGGKRMEKGRGAAAAGQPLYIRAGRLSDPPFGGHLPGNSRTRKPVCCHGVFVCALHGVSPRDRWSCVLPRWQINVNVNVNVPSADCGGWAPQGPKEGTTPRNGDESCTCRRHDPAG